MTLKIPAPLTRHIALVNQFARFIQLIAQDTELRAFLHQHILGALQLGPQACKVFIHRLHFCCQRLTPRFEQILLVSHVRGNQRITRSLDQVWMKLWLCLTILLSHQTGLHGTQREVLMPRSLINSNSIRIAQAHQQLALFDELPLFDQHLFDHSARGVLHRFALGIDGHSRRRRHPLVQRRQHRPQDKATQTDQQRPQAQADRATRIAVDLFLIGNIVGLLGRFRQ